MRVDKPIGTFLLLWPTLWAVWIAGDGHPSWKIVAIFIAGVILMRAAGCVINDLADRKLDGHVTRTKERPLVTQAVTVKQALILTAVLCGIAFLLVLQLNIKTILLAVLALALSTLYPFMKRYTHFPQVILGVAWYIGLLMAFTAQQNALPPIAWALYLTVILWTVVYDTFYAMVDRQDDLLIGIKSTAILFGHGDRIIIAGLQGCVIALLWFTGSWWQAAPIYYISVILAAMLFIYQQWLVRDRQPAHCFRAFLNNHYVGLIIFLGILGS
jgi:4-hydroxybenzoate polyprenyltransferase